MPPDAGMPYFRLLDRASRGFALIAAGSLFLWIPYLRFLGLALILIGLILLVFSNKVYSARHRNYTRIALECFIIGITIWVLSFLFYSISLSSYLFSGAAVPLKQERFHIMAVFYGMAYIVAWSFIMFSILSSTWSLSTRIQSVFSIGAVFIFVSVLLYSFLTTGFSFWSNSNNMIFSGNYSQAIDYTLRFLDRNIWYEIIPGILFALSLLRTRLTALEYPLASTESVRYFEENFKRS